MSTPWSVRYEDDRARLVLDTTNRHGRDILEVASCKVSDLGMLAILHHIACVLNSDLNDYTRDFCTVVFKPPGHRPRMLTFTTKRALIAGVPVVQRAARDAEATYACDSYGNIVRLHPDGSTSTVMGKNFLTERR